MGSSVVTDGDRTPETTCRMRYRRRRDTCRWYRRVVGRLVRVKRIYQGAVIGYVVFDPTVAGVLPYFLLSLLPIIGLQIVWSRRWNRARRSLEFYRRALERLQGTWRGKGDAGDRYRDSSHLYSEDLDLFGQGSLFQWLCAPHMSWGCDVLASWLTHPADATTIGDRQKAVRELAEDVDVREATDALPHATDSMGKAVLLAAASAQRLVRWGWLRGMLTIFAWGWCGCLVGVWFRGGGWWQPAVLGLVAELLLYWRNRAKIHSICSRGYELSCSLKTVATFAEVAAGRTWKSQRLDRIAGTLTSFRSRPRFSAVSGLGLLLQLPAAYFLAIQMAPWIERRLLDRLQKFPAAWAGIGEWETLAAFGSLAHENPTFSFPEICPDRTCFVAQALAHPLLGTQRAVANDVRLDDSQRMMLVSGTNMSGKSTLLRAVGTNAVLALAGAPVNAASLTLSPFIVTTAMRFQDSLGAGTSYFYAVLQRIRIVLNQLRQPQPLLFLLDEILPGTNSHDRRIGAEAIIRRLLASDAVGLVTTHDLELTQIAEQLTPAAVNVHFADEVVDGRLHFDYRLRPGIVQSSNALRLMRDLGLDV